MERLDKRAGPTIIQLAHQRRLRREQPEHEPGLEGVHIVDADPPVSGSPSLPVSQPPFDPRVRASLSAKRSPLPMEVEQAKAPAGESRMVPALPAPLRVSVPSCPLCQDRGYLRANAPFGHPQFGKLVECKCKQARKHEAHRQRLRDQSQIDQLAVFQEETFASFQFWLPGVKHAYEGAKQFAETPQGWLVLAVGMDVARRIWPSLLPKGAWKTV